MASLVRGKVFFPESLLVFPTQLFISLHFYFPCRSWCRDFFRTRNSLQRNVNSTQWAEIGFSRPKGKCWLFLYDLSGEVGCICGTDVGNKLINCIFGFVYAFLENEIAINGTVEKGWAENCICTMWCDYKGGFCTLKSGFIFESTITIALRSSIVYCLLGKFFNLLLISQKRKIWEILSEPFIKC